MYNDLDEDVVNLFRVLRSDRAAVLIEALRLTPYAREEFEEAYEPSDDDVERARRLVIRSYMGFGSDGHNVAVRTGFRANSNRSNTTPAHDWTSLPGALAAVAERFCGVVIENRRAIDVMTQHDGPSTLHYVDPPYLPSVRSQKSHRARTRYHAYAYEMEVCDHVELLAAVGDLVGAVVISGYAAPMYEKALAGWTRTERAAMADSARPRTEVLWFKPAKTRNLIWS